MSKRHLSPAPLPVAKRQHGLQPSSSERRTVTTFDNVLYDELILFIFSYLDSRDLCAVEATNKNCSRLASDNQLWKALFVREFGKARLRGGRGFYGTASGRVARPLPSRVSLPDNDVTNWKWMYRVSSNWRNGRCVVESFGEGSSSVASPLDQTSMTTGTLCPPSPKWHVLLAGSLTVFATSERSQQPTISFRDRTGPLMKVKHESRLDDGPVGISAIAIDQSQSPSGTPSHGPIVSFVAFLTTGEFSVYDYDSSSSTTGLRLTYVPLPHHRLPVTHAAYHHPVLVTLSHTFTLMIYDLSGNTVAHTQTLTSFTSHPPTSMVLSAMPSTTSYKLVLAYAVPVYPSHWSVGATELIISRAGSVYSSSTILADSPSTLSSFVVSQTRSARAFDVPQGWIDEQKLQLMRAQWDRKVKQVADTQTDGKWVVLAPGDAPLISGSPSANSSGPSLDPPTLSSSAYVSSPSYSSAHLQLYRLHMPSSASIRAHSHAPKLTFVRTLHGPRGRVLALALADGRCVSLSADGSIWVWDLESGGGAEVAPPVAQSDGLGNSSEELEMRTGRGTVIFDERRIVSAGTKGIEERRFDI
ncbi:hypothetical protein ID866_5238 [Astraeus odoratus]|nr:hypothetical protein ID866_5238 [Astraeus odoratus]